MSGDCGYWMRDFKGEIDQIGRELNVIWGDFRGENLTRNEVV